jgi:hypothetical protein
MQPIKIRSVERETLMGKRRSAGFGGENEGKNHVDDLSVEGKILERTFKSRMEW